MYVIIGATGNTGVRVTDKLLDAGQKVRVVVRDEKKLKLFVDRGAEALTGSVENVDDMSRAFTGARAVYVMVPPNAQDSDFLAYAKRVYEALALAIERGGVQYVVALSSLGAELSEGTGPVAGLHFMEERLNRLPNINVLSLRPTWFMENSLVFGGMIRQMGMIGGAYAPHVAFPAVATKDVADFAGERLMKLDFTGKSFHELLGPRDLSLADMTRVIGESIGKPDLAYVQFSDDDVKNAIIGMGVSPDLAGRYVELSHALTDGTIHTIQGRSAKTNTPTTYEEFVQEHLAAFQ